MKKDIMGVVDLSWNLSLTLPLAEAHKLQALLTTAFKYNENGYSKGKKFTYTTAYSAPAVKVQECGVPLYDATMLSDDEASEWRDAVAKGLEESDNPDASNIVPPALWAAMKGESK